MSNILIYRKPGVVESYSQGTSLQAPERTILNLLKGRLSEMTMLDIGVGGGRTTQHFAKLVSKYIAIDYSEEMIASCNKRYPQKSNNISFKVCDVRSMEIFKDNTFDFILFSFNGIDSVSHSDRFKAFKEIKRVGKPGAHFCFSALNLLHSPQLFGFKHWLSLHPKRMAKNIFTWWKLRFVYNKGMDIKKHNYSQYAIYNNGAHNFQMQMYHIKPIEQIKQLNKDDYFKDVRVYSLNSGREIKSEVEFKSIKDPWLYYYCVIN